MRRICGTFNGTGADVYICCGFVPDAVKVWDMEIATYAEVQWNKLLLCTAENAGGFSLSAADVAQDELGRTEGIEPYWGGEALTSTSAGTTTYGEGVYLKEDPYRDYRYYSGNKGWGDAVAEDIISWTLDTLANATGHFNEDVNGTYIGEGSRIIIATAAGKLFVPVAITALTAGQGEAANEVTLSYPVPSGEVRMISGMYSYKPMIAGEITPAGFKIDYAFTNNNLCGFIAEMWD